jgi:hypothetical protein
MSRYNIATGAIPNNPLTVIIDTQGKAMAISIQNVSAQDFYFSSDAATLQNVSPANAPLVGHHMPPDSVPPYIFTLPSFKGKLYARAQNNGAQAEASTYENC